MKNKLTIILWVLIIFVVFYFIFQNFNHKTKLENNEPKLTEKEELVILDSFETKILNPSNDYVKFEVKYPYFKKAGDNLNKNIEDLIEKQINDHISISKENWQARYDTQTKGDNILQIPSLEDKFYFFSDFEIIQSNSNYISMVLSYGGFSGGAHGYKNIVSYNYNVLNQKFMELKEIFTDDQDYLKNLSTQSRQQLKKQFATLNEEDKNNSDPQALKDYLDNITSSIDSGTEPIVENFSIFTFSPDKIKIYFAEYQVGPYAIGTPEVEFDRK